MPHLQIAPQHSLYYLDVNPSGKYSILLLHGLGATGDSWAMQIPALVAAGYRVIAPDARGFGRSPYPGGSQRVSDMAADSAHLLKELGVAPADVVGISMGGTIALQLALDYPDLVHRLALVNTFARLKPPHPSVWVYYGWRFVLLHTLGLPVQARAVSKRIFPHPDQGDLRDQLINQILQANPKAYRATMRTLARFNVEPRLPEISVPALVVTGDCDSTVSPPNQTSLVQMIPQATQVVIPGAGHAVTVDHPQEFNTALLNFLIQKS